MTSGPAPALTASPEAQAAGGCAVRRGADGGRRLLRAAGFRGGLRGLGPRLVRGADAGRGAPPRDGAP